MAMAVRATLLNLPSKLAQYVEPDALELIEYEIRLSLEELSRYDIEIPEIQDDTSGDAERGGEIAGGYEAIQATTETDS